MLKPSKESIQRVQMLLYKQTLDQTSNGTLTVYKAQKVRELIDNLNSNMSEIEMSETLREINKHMRLDIFSIVRHATGQVN